MIIVTGGAGFIGSNLVRGLNARGYEDILVVDDLQNGEKHRNLNSLVFRDLVDYRDFLEDLDQLESVPLQAIFHQGACSDTTERDGRYMMQVNYEYSKRLLAFTQGRTPFFYASSASVYGDGEDGFREDPHCEYPLNVYAFSKFLFDRCIRAVLPNSKSQVVGLRYFNVYGPQENHKGRMASVIYKFHHQIREKGELELFSGSDGFRRDFVHVDDAVAMNLFFFDHPEISGIFNCGTGQAESFRQLATLVAGHYEGAEVLEIPFPEDLQGKYQVFTRADLSAVRGAGYHAPFKSLEEGVRDYVELLQSSEGYHRRPTRSAPLDGPTPQTH